MDIKVGTLLCGKYLVVRALGSGGSSDVFEARYESLNKAVVVKVLAVDDTSRLLARREKLAGSIRSQHVIDIYDVDTDAEHGALVIAMEFLEGSGLRTILASVGALPEEEAVTVLRHVLMGVGRAHERGIIHGDLKPDNVFCVDRKGEERAVVLDFGIASLERAASNALTRTVGGTPLWMNPEALRGRDRTWRADTWAVGLLAFEMLAGRHYWESENAAQLTVAILGGPKASPSELLARRGERAPAWLDAFFGAAVSLNDTQLRPADALLSMLPSLPTRVPRVASNGHRVAVATGVDQLAATGAYVPPEELAAMTAASETHGSPLNTDLLRILPESMRPSAPEIGHFLGALFEETVLDGTVLRLTRPRLDFAKAYQFFLVALASSKASALGTVTFLSYTQGLEDLLGTLERNVLKVVIVVVDKTELGIGVRARIAELFRTHRVALIPAFVGDVAALRGPSAKEWLKQRWEANRPVTNPFEPRVLDRTLLQGHLDVLNGLVHGLSDGSAVFGVYGAPGTGKTSLVRRVESDMQSEADFYWISCSMLPVEGAARTILQRAAETFKVPFEIVDGRPNDTFTAGVTKALLAASANGKRLVVVLDDADVIVDPTLVTTNQTEQKVLFELRNQISSLLEVKGICVVVIGLRAFMLEREMIAGVANPLRRYFRRVSVRPFQSKEIEALCSLGAQVDLDFEAEAIKRVEHWSSGNVYVAQMICSRLLDLSKRGELTTVSRKRIDEAAAELIASRQSFEKRLMPWLTEIEKQILAIVPRVAFGRPVDLVPLLPSLSDEAIGNALDYLVEMGVLTRPKGKTRVAGQLLEQWVKTHMSPPESTVRKRRDRSLRVATLGLVLSALLYGVGTVLFGAGLQNVAVPMATCITTAMMPKRLIANEKAKIQLIRQCPNDVAVTLTTIELRGKGNTFLKFDTPPSTATVYERKVTEADKPRVEEEITFWVTDNNEPSYALEVVADGKVAQATFDRNWLGALPGFLRLLLTAAGAVPALLGLLMAFYADARTLLEKLLSRAREAH